MHKASEINNEYKITDRTVAAAKNLNEEHKITERLATGVTSAIAKSPALMSAAFKLMSNANNKK